MAESIENPISNGPYGQPLLHFELAPSGPTGAVNDGRRPSESFVPVPAPKKGHSKDQQALDLDVSGERRDRDALIIDIRSQVDLWRRQGYAGVTPISRKLLQQLRVKFARRMRAS